jgi:Tol biopolymer transport system component
MRAALTRLLLACTALPLAACPTSPGRYDPPTLAWRTVPTAEEAGVAFSPIVVEVHGGDDGTVVALSLVSSATTVVTTTATSRGGVAIFDDVRHGVAETVQLRAAVGSPAPEIWTTVQVTAGPATALPIAIASVPDGGGQANQASDTSWSVDGPPSLSADGRFVAFHSVATNLVAGGTSGVRTVFVRDVILGRTSIASGAVDGGPSSTDCDEPSISADGRIVAFVCDTNTPKVFIRDRQTGLVEHVDYGLSPVLSGNGRYLAYNRFGIYLYDRLTGARSRADVSSGGSTANGTSNVWPPAPALSRTGRFVAFASVGSNLVPGDTNGGFDYFLHDRDVDGNGVFDEPGGMATERVSLAPGGGQMTIDRADTVGVSDDGRYVAFAASGSIYVRDRAAGVTTLVSGGSFPTMSADGRFVAYASGQIYVWDRTSGSTALVSADASGTPGNVSVSTYIGPSISADGRYVAFVSAASNLVPGDVNGLADVFVAPNPLYP